VQLQQNVDDVKRRGVGLAAISYDPPATLKAFADQRGITFPLLSDNGSATIKRYGILNTEATGKSAGIPYPGTFVLDPRGVVVSRSFEERYTERASAASLMARTASPSGSAALDRVETNHLIATTSVSDDVVAPGTRFSLQLDVFPKPKMHVYAPDQKDYIPISLKLEPSDAFKAHAPVFPKAEKFLFVPLNETQLVYSKPFRIVQDVTVSLTPAMRERARGSGASLTIKATMRYQACDDQVCYVPKEIPVTWTARLRALER
jgi:hypothetical protein